MMQDVKSEADIIPSTAHETTAIDVHSPPLVPPVAAPGLNTKLKS
jgi:hypothetical protein